MKQNNKGKSCYITIDFEDWYTLPYLKKYDFKESDCESFCIGDFWNSFLYKLNEMNINPSFFVVATMTDLAKNTINQIVDYGFFVGCHSFNHENLKDMSIESFISTTLLAKSKLEKATQRIINCYRAPSFSSTMEMTLILPSLGFVLDSSYINSRANEYYSEKNFSSWKTNQDGFLITDNTPLIEAEIPTVRFMGKRLPIGGGGFFRLFPFWFYKYLIKKYLATHSNFLFFIHPYELNYHKFKNLKKLTLKERLKFNLNRKGALKKFWKLINFLNKEGLVFKDFSSIKTSCLQKTEKQSND